MRKEVRAKPKPTTSTYSQTRQVPQILPEFYHLLASLARSVAAFQRLRVDPVPREDFVAVVDFLGFAEPVAPVAELEGTELLA